MLSGVLPSGGVDPDRLRGDLARRFRHAFEHVASVRTAGEAGFFDLPGDRTLCARVREAADGWGRHFEAVVVVGIGGSALGAAALKDGLLPPSWNELDSEARKHFPKLYILDNPDPDSVSALLGRLNLDRTLFNVVSKSGSTAETLALFLVIWRKLEDAVGPKALKDRLLLTTGEGPGVLRKVAREFGIRTLPVPGNVGGRFSVLSPVGLFPAASGGIDIEAVLAGAGEMAERCSTSVLTENPAGVLATLLHLADTEQGAGIHVFMPYADRLKALADWFQQLWAESLGKALNLAGERVEAGPTLLPATGATDQHSQLQLLMEGPRDKVVVFLGRRATAEDVAVPVRFSREPALSCLGGRTLLELLDVERRATAEALRREDRMNMTVMVDRVDAGSLGGLIMLFQIAVLYAGALYGVNPLNQPGVELGKALAHGLLGRKGYERPRIPRPDPRWRV